MRDPSTYFADPISREFAAEAWKIGANPDLDQFFEWHAPHDVLVAVSTNEFERRVITARNWVTRMRDQDTPWKLEGDGTGKFNVRGYYKGTYGRDFPINNTPHIADVEHFYVSAMMTLCAGVFHVVSTVGTAYYEVYLQPLYVMQREMSLIAGFKNLVHNWKQLTGPDKDGVDFALSNGKGFFSRVDIQQFFNAEPTVGPPTPALRAKPPALPAAPPPAVPAPPGAKPLTTYPWGPGEWLSMIAGKFYSNDVLLWPIIWDANRDAIGSNPNVVKAGLVLTIPDISGMTRAALDDARSRGRRWREYK